MLGGIGSCGRVLCCASFLGDFEPVSIRMAKDQKLSLNPTKISGICGRLMCCLKYENSAYDEENRAACKENCQKGCREQDNDQAEIIEDAESSMDQGVAASGKGRNEVRHKKGEKFKGKSEKV
jgi:cell fate regulator YaaT (PSP1 superfamily)